MCKFCWAISLILFLAVSAMIYKFIISGAVVPSDDGRQALLLEPGERDLVLAEMRGFLESVQAITAAVGTEDMPQIVAAARKVGAAAQNEVPGSLVGKLPLSFKRLGFDTHKQFDMLALDAEELGDPGHALQQLSVLMQNCVACHAAYRIDAMRDNE
ncbi:MAG: hypothetical protein ABFS39_15295 [Pseudomonadota bacterium]